MIPDGFDATFRIGIGPEDAWKRLLADPSAATGDHVWLPGFDSEVTLTGIEHPHLLQATKDDEPCAGTDIVITLTDDVTGTRIHVVQSRFGDWLADQRDVMAIGWRHIVADLQTFLATGVHVGRHLRRWGDLGANVVGSDGGLRVASVRRTGIAARLGLHADDLLVTLAGAPVSSLDDLATVLRVLPDDATPAAEWIRGDLLVAVDADPT